MGSILVVGDDCGAGAGVISGVTLSIGIMSEGFSKGILGIS